MIFCGYEGKPGEKAWVEIPVPDAKPIDAMLCCGMQEGKTLIVTAGVHGCEYVGMGEEARRLAEELDPAQICGNVILLPLVNAEGFQGAKQVVPEDNENLNRVFPGEKGGTLSRRIAYAVESSLYPCGDFLIDLHSGDCNESLFPLVFFPSAGKKEVNDRALEAAKWLSVPYRVKSVAKNGLYSWAVQKELPSLLIERVPMDGGLRMRCLPAWKMCSVSCLIWKYAAGPMKESIRRKLQKRFMKRHSPMGSGIQISPRESGFPEGSVWDGCSHLSMAEPLRSGQPLMV